MLLYILLKDINSRSNNRYISTHEAWNYFAFNEELLSRFIFI